LTLATPHRILRLLVKDPVQIVLPGPPRRTFDLHTGRLLGLLAALFAGGTLMAVLGMQGLATRDRASPPPPSASQENQSMNAMRSELAMLKMQLAANRQEAWIQGHAAAGVDGLPAEPRSTEPRVRVAVLRADEPITLAGKSLRWAGPEGEEYAAPSPFAVRLSDGELRSAEGQPLPDGMVLRADSDIGLQDRSYPENLILYAAQGQILVVNELGIERYLAGVLSGEIPDSWPLAAKKAQAVAARSYALVQHQVTPDELFDLEATTDDQVYLGKEPSKTTVQAVRATRGTVLVGAPGDVVPAYYHSSCGDDTEPAALVWGTELDVLQSVRCGYCTKAPRYQWSLDANADEVAQALTGNAEAKGPVGDLRIDTRSPSGRAQQLSGRVGGEHIRVAGTQFRQRLGYNRLRSTRFDVQARGEGFRFDGKGYGHGVGMCQWGALGMAQEGWPHTAILRAYYPGARLAELWP
jgi:stage II sporulation protein D